MKFIHITDSHLVPPGQTLCALDPAARLTRIVDEINRLHGDAAFVVHTGDLSYHGMEPAYRHLAEILGRLTVPHHLLIGNHDDRAAFKRSFPKVPVDADGFVQYAIETTEGVFLMLDTVADGEEGGYLCPARLKWLERQLAAHHDRPVFLFLHHPPFDIGIGSIDASRLAQADALAALLRRHGEVQHIFYGHVHRAIAGSWHGIPTSTVPGTNHQVALYLGPEPEMLGSHEATAYGVCLIEGPSVILHYQDPFDCGPRFVLSDPRSKTAATAAELAPPPAKFDGRL